MTQLKAIIGSCLKWWRIRYQGAINHAADDCPLCKLVGRTSVGNVKCFNCLIMKATVKSGCEATPYQEYVAGGNQPKHALEELQFLFDLIKPRYYRNVEKELNKGGYPKKFRVWMLRAITKKEE